MHKTWKQKATLLAPDDCWASRFKRLNLLSLLRLESRVSRPPIEPNRRQTALRMLRTPTVNRQRSGLSHCPLTTPARRAQAQRTPLCRRGPPRTPPPPRGVCGAELFRPGADHPLKDTCARFHTNLHACPPGRRHRLPRTTLPPSPPSACHKVLVCFSRRPASLESSTWTMLKRCTWAAAPPPPTQNCTGPRPRELIERCSIRVFFCRNGR